jgi:hypothetical protein
VAQTQAQHGDEHLPGGGAKPQLSLVSPPDARPDAVWFTGCAWCERIRVRGRWLDETAAFGLIGDTPHALTHGICPDCFSEVTLRAADERRQRRTA